MAHRAKSNLILEQNTDRIDLGRRAVTVQAEHGSASQVKALAGSGRRVQFGSLVASAASYGWTPVHALKIGRFELGATSGPCEGSPSVTCLYAIAGEGYANNSTYTLNSVEMYTPSTNTWTTAASLQTRRAGLGATSGPCSGANGNDCLYAIGGVDSSNNVLASVERDRPGSPADVASNRWGTVEPLQIPRQGLAATSSLCANNFSATCVYAIGGIQSFNDSPLSSVEMYNPGNHTWTPAAPLQMARYALAATSGPCQNDPGTTCLYAIGGYGNTGSNVYGDLASVEMYNPGSDTWTTVAPLNTARDLLAAASGPCSDNLNTTCPYAIGGYDANNNPLTSVEMYGSPSSPTAALVSRFTAQRRGEIVSFHWKLAHSAGVAGFTLYAGQTRLNARTIAVHAAAAYHSTVHWSGPGRLTLRVLLTNGRFVTVPAR